MTTTAHTLILFVGRKHVLRVDGDKNRGIVPHFIGAMGNDQLCPFCRAPTPTSEEDALKRVKKHMDVGDA